MPMHSSEDFAFGRKPIDGQSSKSERTVSRDTEEIWEINLVHKEFLVRVPDRDRHSSLLRGSWRVLEDINEASAGTRCPGTAAVSAGAAARAFAGRLVRHAHMARGPGHHSDVDLRYRLFR